jgi:hypothetical protein
MNPYGEPIPERRRRGTVYGTAPVVPVKKELSADEKYAMTLAVRRSKLKDDAEAQQAYKETVGRQNINISNPLTYKMMTDGLGRDKGAVVFKNYQPPTPRPFDRTQLTEDGKYRDDRAVAEDIAAGVRSRKYDKAIADKTRDRMIQLTAGIDIEPGLTPKRAQLAQDRVARAVLLRKVFSRISPADEERRIKKQITVEELANKYGIK